MKCDIAVVGGGVLGVTTAYWLSELYEWSVVMPAKGDDAVPASSN